MTRQNQVFQVSESFDGSSCRDWADASYASRIEALKSREPEDHQRDSLTRIIQSRVIPKLLLAHKKSGATAVKAAATEGAVLRERVGEFADLVINRDAAFATSYFEDLLADGQSVELLFRDLLAPTARRLGELWDEDINSFMDVTQGLSHLQQLVRTFSPEFTAEAGRAMSNRRALIIPFPGEKHTFGAALIEQYFRRDGWHVWAGPPATLEEVIALVGNMWFDVAGFSIGTVADPDQLAREIKLVRHASRNRNMAILVGGLPFVMQPALAASVGADATAADGEQAVHQVTCLIGKPALG